MCSKFAVVRRAIECSLRTAQIVCSLPVDSDHSSRSASMQEHNFKGRCAAVCKVKLAWRDGVIKLIVFISDQFQPNHVL